MLLLDTNCTDRDLYIKNHFYHIQYEMLKNAENNTYKTYPQVLKWAKLQPLSSFAVTAQQFYSHGDGTHPGFRNDSDKPGENWGIHVVLHMVTVVCISPKNLDLFREREREREKDLNIIL